jgi:hypothetical protein
LIRSNQRYHAEGLAQPHIVSKKTPTKARWRISLRASINCISITCTQVSRYATKKRRKCHLRQPGWLSSSIHISPVLFKSHPCSRRTINVNACFWWLSYLVSHMGLNRGGYQYRNKVVVTVEGGSISGRDVCSAINCASKSGPMLRRSTSIGTGGVMNESVITIPLSADII